MNEKRYILAIDIGASKMRIQSVDEQGNCGPENLANIVGIDFDNSKFLKLLADNIKLALNGQEKISAISIAAPGLIDSTAGIIKIMPNVKNVRNLNLFDGLKEFNLPVFLMNDADAGALGEWWLGSGKGFSDLIYLTLGTGLGSGKIIEDKIQKGSELGHSLLSIEQDQRQCSCGDSGHAEAYLGTRGLAETYAKIFDLKAADLSQEDIFSISPKMRVGVAEKNEKWLKVQDEYSSHLTGLLKNIISNSHPQVIILGGGIIYGNDALLDQAKEKVSDNTQIVLAKFENSGIIGAAKYAFDQLK